MNMSSRVTCFAFISAAGSQDLFHQRHFVRAEVSYHPAETDLLQSKGKKSSQVLDHNLLDFSKITLEILSK